MAHADSGEYHGSDDSHLVCSYRFPGHWDLPCDAGHSVIGVDVGLFSQQPTTSVAVLAKSIRVDIRDISLQDLEGCDAIIHLAALSNDPLGDLNPSWTHEINYQSSVRLAQLAKQASVKRYLFSSSCSVYGQADGDELVIEDSPVAHPPAPSGP